MNNIETMKLALEALETNNKAWKSLADSGDAGWWEAEEQPFYEISFKAITSLRQAIEQAQQAEPVATNIMRQMLEVQGQHGNWNYDSYMHGLYNGMEYMVALAEKREPQFRDAPEEWLAKREVKRDNFNNAVELTDAHGIKENT